MENKKHASYSQLAALVDHFQQHKELITNKMDNIEARSTAEKLWQELAERLNAMGGVIKSVEKWKQTWRDLKSNIKKRASRNKAAISGADGGPSTEPPLTELEAKVLAIIGSEAVFGIQGIRETVKTKDQDPSELLHAEGQRINPLITVDDQKPIIEQSPVEALPVSPRNSLFAERTKLQPQRVIRKPKKRRGSTHRELINIEKEKLEIKRKKLEIDREGLAVIKSYKKKKLQVLNRIAEAIEKLEN